MSAATSRFEVPHAPNDTAPARHQRGDGAVEIEFARRGAATKIVSLYQRNPCRAAFPRADDGEPCLALLLNTAGGLTGGDRAATAISAGAASAATITSAAAEKIYRSPGDDCAVSIALRVEAGAWLEWLPQETILFAGSRLGRGITARVAPTGRLLAAEMLVFGRVARGERWQGGALRERWRIERDGALAWYDAMNLSESDLGAAAGLGGAEAMATALYVGADATRHLELARDSADRASCRAAATLVNGVLLARFIGPARQTRGALAHYIGALRHAAAGLARAVPRVWHL